MEERNLTKYLLPINVWALAIGCSIGWGAFVMPGSTVLPLAGPLGTGIGHLIGMFLILIIGWNYLALMRKFPDSGGAYTYIKNIFGYDHAFLNAWFLLLTYVAIIWANASGLLLISERLIGNFFKFGFSYKILGASVYLGEILMLAHVLIFFAWLCMKKKRLTGNFQGIIALISVAGIMIGCLAVLIKHQGGIETFKPLFNSELDISYQILNIVALAPWVYVGFESVSHSVEEFDFPIQKAFKLLIITIASIVLSYGLLVESAAAFFPDRYSSWDLYIADIKNLHGIENLPTFFAVNKALGDLGVMIFYAAAIGVVVTGIIGGYVAASRLVYSVAKDEVIPSWFADLDEDGTPRNAIKFICILALFAPIVGKTFNGWTVDLLSISASIVYGYVSAAAYRVANDENDRRGKIFGIIGVAVSILFLICFLIPNVLAVITIQTGSYLILCVFGILGFAISSKLLSRDRQKRFGTSVVIYVAMLFLIFFSSLMWMRQAADRSAEFATENLRNFYHMALNEYNIHVNSKNQLTDSQHITEVLDGVKDTIHVHIVVQMITIALGLAIVFSIYTTSRDRRDHSERRRRQLEVRNEELERHVSIDALTGLMNKRTIEETLSQICRESCGAMMIIDLDSFKLVNDLHGHSMGDQILIEFAKIIRNNIDSKDLAGRLGGDEFIAFCHDLLDEKIVAEKSRAINDQIFQTAKRLMGSDMNIPLGASIGCVLVPLDGSDFVELFKKADKALYSVKQHGKHGFKFFTQDLSTKEIEDSLLTIELILSERNQDESASLISFDDFQTIYRHLKRKNSPSCILLLTLSDPSESNELLELLKSMLGQSDSIVQSGQNQFIVLLCDVGVEDVDRIVRKIQEISPVSFKSECNSIQ